MPGKSVEKKLSPDVPAKVPFHQHRLVKIILAIHLVLLILFAAWSWVSTVVDLGDDEYKQDAIYKSEQRIRAQIAQFPPDSRCLLLSNRLAWEVAYITAPRRLYRYSGDEFAVRQFVRAYNIQCIVVYFGKDGDGVFHPRELMP